MATKITDSEFRCKIPFEALYIHAIPWENEKGYAFLSGPCFCYAPANKILEKRYNEVANDPLDFLISDKRLEFLTRIIQHDYTNCGTCPVYRAKEHNGNWTDEDFGYFWPNDVGQKIKKSWNEGNLKTIMPYRLSLGLDETCNLHCLTCRLNPKVNNFEITDGDLQQISYIISKVNELTVGGDGEVFSSRNYKKFLSNDIMHGSLKSIDFFTNGTLFNEKNWNIIHPANQKAIIRIRISLDAACEDTYKLIRGDHWSTLMKNIEFIKELKKDFNFELFTNFTISKYNLDNVESFADFALNLGFGQVQYSFARPLFHPEVGKSDNKFIIPVDERGDIIELLKLIREKYDDYKIVLCEAG